MGDAGPVTSEPSDTHIAARIESRLQAGVATVLERAGWAPAVEAHTGYGLAGSWVRVLARVVLRPPGFVPAAGGGDSRGWRRFLGQSAPDVAVRVRLGDATALTRSSREGYIDLRLRAGLEPGWATAQLSVVREPERGEPTGQGRDDQVATAHLRILASGPSVGLLSDIDDTVMVTMLPRPLVALRNAFWLREHDRRPVPGMADLYAAVLDAHPDAFVVYLSTGAWNAAPGLHAFLARHGYPAGPLLLTDWGPTPRGWFRSGREHKRTQLARLLEELPESTWLLVGDDGQHDPRLYAGAAAAHPGRVLGVAIRQLSVAEQVATHGGRGPLETGERAEAATVRGPDGNSLLAQLRARGLLPPASGS